MDPYCYQHGTTVVSLTDPDLQSYQNIDGRVVIPGMEIVTCPSNVCYHNQDLDFMTDGTLNENCADIWYEHLWGGETENFRTPISMKVCLFVLN